jgi:outer membrane lipoprotein-sorting protein
VKRRRPFLLDMMAAAGTLAFPAPARADAVGEALADITKARAPLKTLVAGFRQERTIGLLASAVTSDGEMTLVRPDRLRWELKPPDAVTYWITPEGFAYATPSGSSSVGKAAAGKFAPVLGDLLVLLGGDLEKLRARYEFSIVSPRGAEGGLVLAAKPKADDLKKGVRSIELAMAPDLWSVRRVTIEEPGGDRSVITFGKPARDVKVDPAKMTPPRGR